MPRPVKYNKPRTIKFSDIQDKTLNKLATYEINVAQFIRDAVKEKLQREGFEITNKPKKKYCPFSNGTIEIN